MSQSKKEEKRRRESFGGALCGFVNAQTTDEAYFPILTGIQQPGNFSSSFVEEVKKVFPTIGDIAPPPKDWKEEKEEMTSYQNKFNSDFREKWGSHFGYRYNRSDQCFELNSKYFPVSGSKPSPLDSSLLPQEDELISKMIEVGTLKLFANDPKLLEIVRNKSLIEDISNLQNSWTRHNTILLHRRIGSTQEQVRMILDELFLDKPLKIITSFRYYLKIYNELPGSIMKIDQQDSLKGPYPINEEDYFSIELPLKWYDRLKSDLAYCLVKFLIPEGNRKHIYRCDECGFFYIPKKLYISDSRLYFCSDSCRGKYHRPNAK